MTSVMERVVLRSSTDLDLAALEAIVWHDCPVILHADLLEQLAMSRAQMLDALADGGAVYGVTTGMGYLAGVELTENEKTVHQANLLLGRAVGGPPYLERHEARALLAARLAGYLGGKAGVSPELCGYIADRLNDDFVPAVPRKGAGSAGEIIPLAHAFQTFLGVGYVIAGDGGRQQAAKALAARGVAPYRPGPKEGIALLAGAPGALALAIHGWRCTRTLTRQLLLAYACAIDAIRAPLDPYDPVVAELAGDPVMEAVLASLGRLLRVSDGDRRPMQAPVSFRVIPQVLTHLHRLLQRTEEDLRRGLGATTDSPAFVHGRFLSTGGFHAVDLTSDMDQLCIGLVQAAELAVQHIHRLLDTRFSGLPDQLTLLPGPRVGLVAVHKRAIGTISELRRLAMPAGLGLHDTSMGQEDAMAFSFESADKLRSASELLREVVACELLVCHQAWSLRSDAIAAGLQEYADEIAATVEPVDEDRPLGEDIATLAALIASERFQG